MPDTIRETTLGELLEEMLDRCGPIILRNPHGAMELRGTELYLKRGKTLTVYHRGVERGESRSHVHLQMGTLGFARVVERGARTPHLAFWPGEEDDDGGEAPVAIYFPSFYDWSRGKDSIPDNQQWFADWVAEHGRVFRLLPDERPERRNADDFESYFWGYAYGRGTRLDDGVKITTTDRAVANLFSATWHDRLEGGHRTCPRFNLHHPERTYRSEVDEYDVTLSGGDLPDPADLAGLLTFVDGGASAFWRGVTDACGILCFRKEKRRLGVAFSHAEHRRVDALRRALAARSWAVTDIQQSKTGNWWFDIADDDVPRFGDFIYADAGDLHSPARRARYDKALGQLAEAVDA